MEIAVGFRCDGSWLLRRVNCGDDVSGAVPHRLGGDTLGCVWTGFVTLEAVMLEWNVHGESLGNSRLSLWQGGLRWGWREEYTGLVSRAC